MAEYNFTAALNADTAPLVTTFQGRSIVISGLDNKLKDANAGAKDGDAGNNPQNLPQVLYYENVMPTEKGMQSVGFAQIQAPAGGGDFDEGLILRSDDERHWYYSPSEGANWVLDAIGGTWTQKSPLGAPTSANVSVAYVNGRTFVLFAKVELLEWNPTTEDFDTVTPTGVAVADIVSITGSGNYLIATTNIDVLWSSLVDPTDFVPSDSTGAGRQVPVDIRGQINLAIQQPGGFLIFCEFNTVAAFYTQNSGAPWIFREVKNSGGINNPKQVTRDSSSGTTYVWGTNGFQTMTLREAENLFPSITDFLAGRVMETFDTVTNLLTVTRLSANVDVKLAYVAGRYVIISFGTVVGTYEYAHVYDTALKRWGKVKVTHVDCFPGLDTARQSLYFLNSDGSIYQAIIDYRSGTDFGILLMGKYQLNRTNQIGSQELQVEVLDSTSVFTVHVAASYTGANYDWIQSMLLYLTSGPFRKFQRQGEGVNLTYIIKGSFEIATIMLTASKGAKF